MKKLNSIVYNKLLVQASEAKEQGITKLADNIYNAVGSHAEEDKSEYSYGQLNEDIHKEMWKLATNVINYYGLESVSCEKLDEVLESLANKFVSELEKSLNVDGIIVGPNEQPVPGETK